MNGSRAGCVAKCGAIGVLVALGAVALRVAVALGVVVPAAASTAAATAARPSPYCARQNTIFTDHRAFIGISDPYVEAGSRRFRNCSFGRMAATHIGLFRGGLSWAQTESVRGHYSFDAFDELIAELARHHMRFLPVLLDPPRWASTQPARGRPQGMYPPARPAQFAAWAAACARRYGPRGTFWRAHPRLPHYPVRAWEVWNEPNLKTFWAPRPNARAYVRLLRASASAIRHVDRHATVLAGGMPFFGARDETAFLDKLYRAGARGSFDVLALHTYSPTVAGALGRLQTARRVMNRFGDRRKPIWDTEWSWAGGPPNPYRVSEAGQRANVSSFLRLVQRNRARLRIGAVIYYGWRDKIYGKGPSWWGYHLGLYTQSLKPKLALGAVAAAARRLDR